MESTLISSKHRGSFGAWVTSRPSLIGPIAAAGIGFLIGLDLRLGGLTFFLALLAFAVVLLSLQRFTALIVASLPILLVVDQFLPPLARTLLSALALTCLLAIASPLRGLQAETVAGLALLLLSLGVGLVQANQLDQLIQVIKYLSFGFLCLLVSSESGRAASRSCGPLLFRACVAAMVIQALVVATDLAGASGSYYGVGDSFGFGPNQHEIALLALGTAVTARRSLRSPELQLALFGLCAYVIIKSGVRSALVPIAMVAVYYAITTLAANRSSLRSRAIVAYVLVAIAFFASGVTAVFQERLLKSEETREFASSQSAGSNRGEIWQAALSRFTGSGVTGLTFGLGLRSMKDVTEQAIGHRLIGHNDILDVGVQLGFIGLVGWLLLWLGLFRSRLDLLLLVSLAFFAVGNGSIEYSSVTMVLLVLSCARRPAVANQALSRS